MSKHIAFLIFNVLGLEITWAACAYGATHNFPMLGVIVGSIYIMIHLTLTPNRTLDLLTLVSIGLVGILLDYANMRFGIVSFGSIDQHFIPLWLIVLWGVFSLMIPHSLRWLGRKPILAAALGCIGGGGSYWLGHKLGAITISEPLTLNLSIYFIQWAIFLPLAFFIFHLIVQNQLKSTAT